MTTYLALALVALSPDDTRPGLQPEDVTPGVIGFLVTLALVLATIPLIRSMTRKTRRVGLRAEVEAQADDGGASGPTPAVETSGATPDAGDDGEVADDGRPPGNDS